MTNENNENQEAGLHADMDPGPADLNGTDQNQADQTARKKTRRGRRGGRRNHRNRTNTEQNPSQQENQAESPDPGNDAVPGGNGHEQQALQDRQPDQEAGQKLTTAASRQADDLAGEDKATENSEPAPRNKPAGKSRSRGKKKPASMEPESGNASANDSGSGTENIQPAAAAENQESAETGAATKSTGRSASRQGRRSSGGRARGRGKTSEAATDSDSSQNSQEDGQDAVQTMEQNSQEPDRKDSASRAKPSGDQGLRDQAEDQEKTEPADLPDPAGLDEEDSAGSAEASEATARPARGRSGARQRSTGKTATGRNQTKASSGRKKMFISLTPGEQVEVALTEEHLLLEYYLDMLHQSKLKGNIYKGVIHNIDTNLQAAFVSYGDGKNGFLQIDEIHPEYWQAHHEPARGKKLPPIQKVLRNGQEVLVQVVKEPIGNKGAFLTTWISLAGRFLVLTPGQEQIGVSRKVEDDAERARLKELVSGIDPGQDMGVIVRTVSAGTTKTTLRNDLQYLKRLWRDIRKKATEVVPPALVHHEPGLPERAVRDYLTDDVCEIWVDNAELAERIRSLVSLLFPRKKDLVHLHTDQRQSLWERFNLLRQFDHVYAREVFLPSGGRLVFDQTEALMAIDINSGKISGKGNFEAMAYKTNMEAAEAIARHLRLRDIGGQVVIDFIEMREKDHTQDVEKALRQAMKSDRARHDIGHISSFGLLELVRQRMGSSAISNTMEPCQHCGGTGQRRNIEWQAQQCLRDLRRLLRIGSQPVVTFETSRELGMYLLNHKREAIHEMEQEHGRKLEITLKV